MSSKQPNVGDNLLTALVSGCTAAGVSATITYPFDFIKTQQQLNNTAYMAKWKIPGNYPGTIGQLYKGGSALVLGSVLKNLTRLILYNWLSKFMALESHGHTKTSAPRIVIAGVISAFFETLCLIPFENIKITMIQNMTLNNEITRSAQDAIGNVAKHHKHQAQFGKQYISPHAYYTSDLIGQAKSRKPSSKFLPPKPHNPKDALRIKYNQHPSLTFFGTVREMYSLKGLNAFTAGSCITMVRQVAISTVWIWTYNSTRQVLDPHNNDQNWFGHKHTAFQLMGLHFLSSCAVIAVTQPLDVIKTHMQLKNGKAVYRDSLTTAYRLFVEQGPRAMFKGSLPRGIKVLVNGGLTALVYNYVEDVVKVAGGQKVFADE
ncbi:mitochondrial carrier [Suhomyces tanzawaensis NRRL Y-17324]|uniref:Mitochondrial thiamine pyrophosphate carrier 1 n=1 Tax=Suhomyces tanzawaensis NRRL Y-17324 TaxID=984487 RepID=A0A1E4SDJ0_9ASCO|nr:mitochondrial carrier [Suhomyces tanzawaensis NRRL Y-17324]ODV77538.1 mitochondrial carrier [Suhomyces tanzawaensis NRRL Y-17324]